MKIRCETQIFNRNTQASSSVGTTKATLAVGVNKKIGLAERTFKHGDFVRRMTDGNPQLGYVRDKKITADVKIIGEPYVIKNVAADRLRPLSIWQRDCIVRLDWVGSVKDVDETAVVKGVNGVRLEIPSSLFHHFEEPGTSGRPKVFTPLIFFPGNIVVGNIVVGSLPWTGAFVVESVRTEGVIVQWKTINNNKPPQPYVSAQQLKNLKRLNVFESCVLKISDRSYLTYEPEDMLISKSKWDKEIATRFKEIFQQQQRQQTSTVSSDTSELSTEVEDSEEENIEYKNSVNTPLANMYNVPEGKELITEALLVYSTVSVVWQDGTVEHDIPSTELYPIDHLDHHDFFPGDFTLLPREDPVRVHSDPYGVIQTVDHQGRTAKVKWFRKYTSADEPNFSPTFIGESEVRVCDLEHHDEFTWYPGGMVLRVSDDAAGQVLDNCIDGRVKISWFGGHTSWCYPQDLLEFKNLDQDGYFDYWDLDSDDEDEGLDNAEKTFAQRDFQFKRFSDQVFLIDKAGRVKFGLIIDCATDETYSSDEDDDEKLGNGDVRVAWYPQGCEHVRSEKTANTKENKCATTSNVEIIQHATGLRYMVRDNIEKIVTKFLEDGEATVCFKEPPENLMIKCDPNQLKKFLQALDGKQTLTLNLLNIASTTATPQKSQPQLKLRVYHNPFDYPTKGFPNTLKKLTIVEIGLDRISSEICSLKNLTSLDLSRNNITKIPPELGKLNLKVLRIDENALGELNNWEWLRGVNLQKSLNTLDISWNKLNFFPKELLKFTSLYTLKLDYNHIRRIPFGIRGMRGLRYLYIASNKLKSLPSAFNQLSLDMLNVWDNPFEPYLDHPEISPDFLDEAPKCACGKLCEKSETVLERAMLATFKNVNLVVKCDQLIYMDIVLCGSKCMGLRQMHA